MTDLDEQTTALLAAAEQDAEYAATLRTARIAESAQHESFVQHAARTLAALESLTRRAESVAEMRASKGRAVPLPRPAIMRDVYSAAVMLNNVLCDTHESGAQNAQRLRSDEEREKERRSAEAQSYLDRKIRMMTNGANNVD